MNTYSSLRKKNNGTLVTVVSLMLCVILSATMLFSRLLTFSAEDTRHYIPLTESGGITQVAVGSVDESGNITFRRDLPYTAGRSPMLSASPFLSTTWFRAYDENTVWSGQTDIEIFKVSYENGNGQVTVNSSNGEKLLAPGTENTYSFALENTGHENVKYEMTMEAFFTDGTHVIPVEVRVSDHEGSYYAGSADHFADVLELNQVSDSGTLKPGYIMPYTLQWRWPFEIDDAYDTMLGNLAVGEDITLTIVIRTIASYTPRADDGIPKTGDSSHVVMYSVIMVLSLAALILLFLLHRPRREEAHG